MSNVADPGIDSAHPAVGALAGVRRDIEAVCRKASRDPASVTLVAISKTFAADVPGHDPRRVPVVRIGLAEPTIVAAPKLAEAGSAQAAVR